MKDTLPVYEVEEVSVKEALQLLKSDRQHERERVEASVDHRLTSTKAIEGLLAMSRALY